MAIFLKGGKAPSILFIGKKGDPHCKRAVEFVGLHFPDHQIYLGKRGDGFPGEAEWWRGDYIVSYLSPWIIPGHLLSRARIAAINFHPGPPEYPGIGCTNFAIYDEAATFGVTCHHMEPKVDTGKLITVKRFPLYRSDTVFSLTQRCYGHILALFYDVMDLVLEGKELVPLDDTWTRRPYTRRELNELCRCNVWMSSKELRRRVKAVTFPNAPGAYVKLHNVKFNHED